MPDGPIKSPLDVVRKWFVWVEWNPADCWVGAFWKRGGRPGFRRLDVWVCLLPMVPLHFGWQEIWRKDR